MKFNWNDQSIVITGAYGGLGKALSKALDELGANLILVGRDESKLQALRVSLSDSVEVIVGDVGDVDSINKLSNKLKANNNKQHMLINNAAISHASFLSDATTSSIQDTLTVNLLAPILLTKTLMPWLKSAQKSCVINIGSSFGGIGYPGFSSYCASKFGLRGFTQALNRELAGTHISASYLAPRAMSTDINSKAVDEMNSELGHAVDNPEDIAQMIISSIEKNHSEKFYGWPEKLFVKLNALLPNLVSKAINKDQSTIQSLLKDEAKL